MKAILLGLLALSCASSFASVAEIKPSQVSPIALQLVADSVSTRNGNDQRILQNGTPCGLCADGSKYTIEGTLPPSDDGSITTCAEADVAAQAMDANDPMCDIIHMAGRHCGCPHVTPEGACDVCFDGSPVTPEEIIDTSAIELTGLDVNMKDIGLPDGSGTAISCGELATNLHTMHVVGELAGSEADNVDVAKDEEFDEALAFLCIFFQNFAGPQCGCPANPNAELCIACPYGALEPDKVTNLSGRSLTCGEAHELIKPIPPGQLCDKIKAQPPPGCACATEDIVVPDIVADGLSDSSASPPTSVGNVVLFFILSACIIPW